MALPYTSVEKHMLAFHFALYLNTEAMSDVFKALSDPTRRAILSLLRDRAMSAGDIAEAFPLARATLSGHFAVLHAAGLVERERRGSTIIYRLRLSVLEEAWLGLAAKLRLGEDRTWNPNDPARPRPSD